MQSTTDNALLSVQTKPNNLQIGWDVFPESVFQDAYASEWFDVACWSQVKPLAHEVIAVKAMMLVKKQQYDEAFELTLSGIGGDVMDCCIFALVQTLSITAIRAPGSCKLHCSFQLFC